MSGLTREECGRIVKAFLMTSGSVALAMVLFALVDRLVLMAFILAVIGIMMITASSVLGLFHCPPRVVYGVMATGLAVTVGAAGGSFVINMVIATSY